MCIHFCVSFSPSYWMWCIRGFCLAASIGKSHTGVVAWSLRMNATKCWDIHNFWRVCAATLDHYSSDPHQEVSALGRIVDAVGPGVSVVSISGGSTILVEGFCQYLESGYCQKLIDYPNFDLRLFKRCLQRTGFSVFGSLDGLAMTNFKVNRLKNAEIRDRMSFAPLWERL